ncbi:hypothetical protein [Bilophila wadsworthia]|jgi:hypothetical protein|uniref:hypothetical protein n=1 Tax=Bilophila wadsworthia TaxID=35833 RepID=UPI00241E3793|nr:hypothetical protein [Bilophila wadsworthia]
MAIDSTGGRLSPENIKDVLLRAELYREIRAAQTKDLEKNWFTYEIQPSETLMPELIAYRAYRSFLANWSVSRLLSGSPIPGRACSIDAGSPERPEKPQATKKAGRHATLNAHRRTHEP